MSDAPAADWPDLAGRIAVDAAGRRHVLPIRVYFEDTDFSGLVYHGSYVRWCERGRSDFLRLVGNDHRALFDGSEGRDAGPVLAPRPSPALPPPAPPVRRMSLDFRRPARIDDVLEVVTRVADIGAAPLTLDQRIFRAGVELFAAEVMVVLVSRSGKPLRLSQAGRASLSAPYPGRCDRC